MKKYDPKIEAQMRSFSQALSEKDRRQYAALEARKLGHGGQTYIAKTLGVGRKTIERGLKEIDNNDPPPTDRIRRVGGGRKPYDGKKSN